MFAESPKVYQFVVEFVVDDMLYSVKGGGADNYSAALKQMLEYLNRLHISGIIENSADIFEYEVR